jgi:hypothetical protein
MKKVKLKWEFAFLERIQKMSNHELMEETLCLAAGDDYDGCFTTQGAREYQLLKAELNHRLKDWLERDLDF